MFKVFKVIVVLLFLGVFSVYLFFFSSIVFPWQRDSVWNTVRDWSSVSDFPSNVHDIEIERRGSIFTREFIVGFTSDSVSIERWINESSRLKDVKPKFEKGKRIYEVYPGEEGALGGTVIIEGDKVTIDMSWS